VEIEGLQFLESMGFMLDNLNFRNLSPEVQEQTIRRIPLFGGRPPAPRPAPAPAKTSMGMPAAGQTGMMPSMSAAFPQVSSTSLGIPVVAPAAPAPAPPAPPAAPALGPRESAALARLLASF
jgi:hypothetical protein